tara:strand:- start:226 stop:486 length:261 start_codon:yes stop_codon:yes gene_type:complete
MLEDLKKGISFSLTLIFIISGMTTIFAFMFGVVWLFSELANIFSGQATKDEYLLFFVVFNVVLTFAVLIFGNRNSEKKEKPNKSRY